MKNNKTPIIDMDDEMKKWDLLDEYLKMQDEKKKLEKKAFLEKLYGKEFEDSLKEFKVSGKKTPPSPPVSPSFLQATDDIPKTIHKPGSEVSKYITRQQSKAKLLRKIDDIVSSPAAKKIGKVAKFGGPLLALASEALSAEDLGDSEISRDEMEKLKAEERMSSKDKEIKKALEEKAKEPLSIKEQLDLDIKNPKIRQFQTEAIIGKPKEGVGQLEKGVDDKRMSRSNRFAKLQKHLMREK